jgi:peptidyl-prolyl cis-trans isomerase C
LTVRKLLPILLLLVPPLASAHDLAIVNGHAITDQEVYALDPAAKENPQARDQLLQELINRTLILQAAKKEGLDQTPAFQKELAQQREQLLVNVAVAQWLKQHPITSIQVKARYEQLVKAAPKEQWRLREILVKDSGEATKILDQLRQGASFSNLAAQSSIGPNAALGGELGWVNDDQLPAPEADAVTKLQVGQVIGPIITPQGYLIVQMLGRRPFVPAPLTTVQQQITKQLRTEALNQYVAELRKQGKVVLLSSEEGEHAKKPE